MKRFKRRLSQTLRGSHTIDESLSELAEQMTIEENGLKDSGEFYQRVFKCGRALRCKVGGVAVSRSVCHICKFPFECFVTVFSMFFNVITWGSRGQCNNCRETCYGYYFELSQLLPFLSTYSAWQLDLNTSWVTADVAMEEKSIRGTNSEHFVVTVWNNTLQIKPISDMASVILQTSSIC